MATKPSNHDTDKPAPEKAPADAPAGGAANPASASKEEGKAKTIEDEGIKPTDPYPTGGAKAQTWAEINGLTSPEDTAPAPKTGG